jgi:hypothetical protein
VTAGEISLFAGLVLNAAAVVYSARSTRNNNTRLAQVVVDVHKIELATNSMKDALVAATGDASFRAGKDEARIEGEQKAAALVRTQSIANDTE